MKWQNVRHVSGRTFWKFWHGKVRPEPVLLLSKHKQSKSFIKPKFLLFTSRCRILIVLSDGPLHIFYSLEISLQQSDFNSVCFVCSSETEADRNRRVQGHFSKFSLCQRSSDPSAPPEVNPQPQESFHMFNHRMCSLERCYYSSSPSDLSFFFSSPSNGRFLHPCSRWGCSALKPAPVRSVPGLIACFRETIKSKASATSPSGPVTF